MNIYTDLVAARDELRRAKDHEQTMRAIAEYGELSGKNADDRKRELAFLLSQDQGWRKAVEDMRDCEQAVDRCQAAIDQADAERRNLEYARRLDEIDVMRETNRLKALELSRPVERAQAQRAMSELFNT